MTGAQATIAQLKAEGVEIVLGIPGIHNMYLCDAVLDYPELRFISGRHEQGITFMANGYARASGRIAVPLVITGPGVTNSLTPLADASVDSVPMVLVASQTDTSRLGKGAFHELKDQTALLSQVTKWNVRVDAVEEISEAINTAFAQAYEGRPGPTAVEVPLNVQQQRGPVELCPAARRRPTPADAKAVQLAAQKLAQAQAPVIYVGSGAASSGCTEQLVQLMDRLQAPCCVTALAKGVVPDDHPLNMGWWGEPEGVALEFLQEADVALVIGSSLDEAGTRAWTMPLPEELIQIDTSPDVMDRHYPVSVPLVGDARLVLTQLLQVLEGDNKIELPSRPSPIGRIGVGKRRVLAEAQQKLGWQYADAVERALPADAFVTNDASRTNGWMIRYLNRYQPRTLNITANMAALGYAFPAAIGAKLAYPDRQAVAVMGDGGFLFTVYSLATAVKHRLNVVVIVFDNHSYGTIAWSQMQEFGREIGAELCNPDFAQMAQSFGAAGVRAVDPDQLYEALLEARDRDRPTVIHVPLP
jgi:acetolactate synthase-1/2/3 large subunit